MIYRILQEVLTNIGKHAAPTQVDITLTREDHEVIMQIRDNGRGFPLKEVLDGKNGKKGMGLLALTERVNLVGGTLELWSQENQGTRITVAIPSLTAE
jgi:two-component system, NarL family, sensor histidine kinase DegS